MTSNTWNGNAMSQWDMMEKDTVLVLNDNDEILGAASKKTSHVFEPGQPRGIVHRAFSVFLFDASTNELLLQQRASSKITFPNVWTNTCCSHPLHGMEPSEVDVSIGDGSVMGVKHAAIRKLDHELGIQPSELTIDKFKFLTRLHYWAADTITHGPKAPWGENEIDYVLFYVVNNKQELTIKGHPDEVDAVAWLTLEQLEEKMADPKVLFSPWFRLIVQKWLKTWWKDLNETMQTDKHCDFVNIHRFDPPKEHLGGAADAGPLFLGDAKKKQGAYGKIKTHSESKLSQLTHLDEVWSAITILYIKPLKSNLKTDFILETFSADDLAFCDEILGKVSRSFAAVIRQLPSTLLVDIMIFYLVLRALDTIEDDTTAFSSNKIKVDHLMNFHKNALGNPDWNMDGVGEADEKRLLQQFQKCHAVFSSLNPKSKTVITDITQRMASGMAEFVGKDMGQGTKDIPEYNRYCHFVAGLVGEGLSRLFAASELEHASMASELTLSDQMGLFLQKVNIIRDYLEDYVDGRAWWPQTVWKKYSVTGDLGYFSKQDDAQVRIKSLECLNELVSDALELGPDCLAYMSKLQCVEVFRFCAIPQVMAISTLDKLYANHDVFTGVVKIRKGLSCKLLLRTNNLYELHSIFYGFATSIATKARQQRAAGTHDPSFDRTMKACDAIILLTSAKAQQQRMATMMPIISSAGLLVAMLSYDQYAEMEWSKFILLLLAVMVYFAAPMSALPTNLKVADSLKEKML